MNVSAILFRVRILLNPIESIAQHRTSEYGKIELADLKIKECSFKQNAPAMVLIDVEQVSF